MGSNFRFAGQKKPLSHIEKQLYRLLEEYAGYVMKYCRLIRDICPVNNPAKRIPDEELERAIMTVERLISVARRMQKLLKDLQKL